MERKKRSKCVSYSYIGISCFGEENKDILKVVSAALPFKEHTLLWKAFSGGMILSIDFLSVPIAQEDEEFNGYQLWS